MLLPFTILPIVFNWNYGWFVSAALTVLASLTDLFDGYIARKLSLQTSLGTILDWAGDKLFIGTMFITLAAFRLIPFWIPAIIISREIIISIFRYTRFGRNPPLSDSIGKAKTGVSFAAIVFALMQQDLNTNGLLITPLVKQPAEVLFSFTPWVLWIAVALTILSGMNYLSRYSKPQRSK